MKRKTNSLFLLGIIVLMLVFAFAPPAQAATYTYTYEYFGSPDADTVNPYSATGEIPYVYAEHGWSGGTAAVDANARFYINTSDAGADGSANFTFNSSSSYDYFEFRFMFLNDWTINQNHSGIEFRVAGSAGTICSIQVYGANTTVGGSTNRIKILDYNDAEVGNASIAKDKWYTVRVNPDYDTWDLNAVVYVYDVSGGTYTVAATTIGLGGNTDMSKFYMIESPATEEVCVTVDNLVLLSTTISHGESTTNYLTEYVFPIMFAVAMLAVITGMLFSGSLDPKGLIMVVVITVVGTVALMIITAVG